MTSKRMRKRRGWSTEEKKRIEQRERAEDEKKPLKENRENE